MSSVLALLAFAAYIVAIVGLAAGVTWIVVRWTPGKKPKPGGQAPS
jgi:hypothetical protein